MSAQTAHAVGKVWKLDLDDNNCVITLSNIEEGATPPNGFVLMKSHHNYEFIYGLALSAMLNRLKVVVKCTDPINPNINWSATNGVVAEFVAYAS